MAAMNTRGFKFITGITAVAGVVTIARAISQPQPGGHHGVEYCFLTLLLALVLADIYLMICLGNCSSDNPRCAETCVLRYFAVINLAFTLIFVVCTLGSGWLW